MLLQPSVGPSEFKINKLIINKTLFDFLIFLCETRKSETKHQKSGSCTGTGLGFSSMSCALCLGVAEPGMIRVIVCVKERSILSCVYCMHSTTEVLRASQPVFGSASIRTVSTLL